MNHYHIEYLKSRALIGYGESMIPVFKFHGKKADAAAVYIQSSVHAAEVQGYLVALYLIEYFAQHQPEGNVTIVPLANPYGANTKVGEYTAGRFDPISGDNYNRHYYDVAAAIDYHAFISKMQVNPTNIDSPLVKSSFKELITSKIDGKLGCTTLSGHTSYASYLNLSLQKIAATHDVVLDLHCDTSYLEHIYTPAFSSHSAKQLGFEYAVIIPSTFGCAMDEAIFMPWVKLYEALDLATNPCIESFTLELGAHEVIDKAKALSQAERIIAFIENKHKQQQKDIEIKPMTCAKLEDFITFYSACPGFIITKPNLATIVPAGQCFIEIAAFTAEQFQNNQVDLKHIVAQTLHRISHDCDIIPITFTSTANVISHMPLCKAFKNWFYI